MQLSRVERGVKDRRGLVQSEEVGKRLILIDIDIGKCRCKIGNQCVCSLLGKPSADQDRRCCFLEERIAGLVLIIAAGIGEVREGASREAPATAITRPSARQPVAETVRDCATSRARLAGGPGLVKVAVT